MPKEAGICGIEIGDDCPFGEELSSGFKSLLMRPALGRREFYPADVACDATSLRRSIHFFAKKAVRIRHPITSVWEEG